MFVGGLPAMPQRDRDSLSNTFIVSALLCIVCSLAVSAAAVALRPLQEANELLDRRRNILDATGLAQGEIGLPASQLSLEQVNQLYERVEERLVDLESGQYVTDIDVDTYNPRDAAKRPDLSVAITDTSYGIGRNRRERIVRVFLVRHPRTNDITQVVLPVYGQGLWSTLYGYLAVKRDLDTVQGLTFYEHGETPGLGGEVDNPRWKQQWVGLSMFDENGNPALGVARGAAPPDSNHLVDGLSGATITANGVTNLIRYWTGPDGYQNFLRQLEAELQASEGETRGN
jgi:Na+-transporting NADH:ubiquinone oxidoreductase subunit C